MVEIGSMVAGLKNHGFEVVIVEVVSVDSDLAVPVVNVVYFFTSAYHKCPDSGRRF